MEVELTAENFENEVINCDIPVLVDFWATWCGPCRMLSPTIDELAKEFDGKIKVGKVNVDEQMSLAIKYNTVSIPTVLIFNKGKLIKTIVGLSEKSEYVNAINSL